MGVPLLFAIMVSKFTKQELVIDATLISIVLIMFKYYVSGNHFLLKYLTDLFVIGYVIVCKISNFR